MNPSLYEASRRERLTVGGDPLEITFAYLRARTQPAPRRFVLLHGNPSHMDHWRGTVPALLDLGDVAVMDMPGFGRSETPHDGIMSLDRLADAALAVSDALHFDDVIAVGQSFGGAVAQTLAARHPTRVRGVVLIASIGTPANPVVRMARLPGAEFVSTAIARHLGAPAIRSFGHAYSRLNARVNFAPDPPPPGFAEADFDMIAERPEIQRNSIRANVRDPTRQLVAQAGSIRAPVLMIHPVDDRVVPIVFARNLLDVLTKSGVDVTFRTTAGGHLAHVARPAEVNTLIREWVDARL